MLTGNAAYGDIARLNFIDNYSAKLLKQETAEGKMAFVLELTAIEGHPVTYDKLLYWVDAKSFRPLKAHYMTSSGKVLREGFFKDFKAVLGEQRPTNIVLVDHLEPKHVTELQLSNAKRAQHPAILFEKQNFGKD
jgi:hypothetical protein